MEKLKAENIQTLEKNWFLTEVSGNFSNRREVYINTDVFRIGRSLESNLTLPLSSVSKVHAQIVIQNDRLVLQDLGSTNGTTVNGNRISEQVLVKNDLIGFADVVFRVGINEEETASCTIESNVGQWAEKLLQFESLINGRGAIPYFQPIVRLSDRKVIGQELLARSDLDSLRNPAAMFEVAAALDQERPLSELMRRIGGEAAEALGSRCEVFMNTHPKEVADERLISNLQRLRGLFPDLRIAIEIHEAAVTDLVGMQTLRDTLRELDMRLAYDDFGAGQARLVELSEVPPDVLKFDMKLIRNIDKASERHQAMVGRFVAIAKELEIEPLAEGVETEAEDEVCQQLGFVTGQGFLYGRPAPKPQR